MRATVGLTSAPNRSQRRGRSLRRACLARPGYTPDVDALRGEAIPDEREAVSRLHTLEDVVRRPDFTIVEIVAQDEYTQDVVVVRAGRFLVFDTT